MATYKAPQRETRFILDEVIDFTKWAYLPGYGEVTSDLAAAIIEQVAIFAERVVAPLNGPADEEGCTWHPDGNVTMPKGYKEARKLVSESGWSQLSLPSAIGGQGLPDLLSFVASEYFCSASQAFTMHSGLNNGSVKVLYSQASPELQRIYMTRIATGEWTSTMNLTEPHCGSDLSLLRTKAVPRADGSYAISGNKIFISGGEHDLTENIVHLVLARVPGAPPGTRGISLFLVPKFLVNEDGSLGERNAVTCTGIEHKMGLRGTATCAMTYDNAKGWLVGEENKGLAGMFILMNSARLSVGIQGLATAEASFQNAHSYAMERRQGRAPGGPRDPDEAADPLIVHPDVRRMLMDAKAFSEAMRCFAMWCGLLVDIEKRSPDPTERAEAADMLGLLTPILKGYGTETGFTTAVNMQQIWGGHGYIVENGMEQYVRDGRIGMIYEGANGIQANDLVQRKIAANNGRALKSFFAMVETEIESAAIHAELLAVARGVEAGLADMKAATEWFTGRGAEDPATKGAVAFHYMRIAGIVTLGMMWLRMAQAAVAGLARQGSDPEYYRAKIVTARYFIDSYMPDTASLRTKIEAGSENLMMLAPEQFRAA